MRFAACAARATKKRSRACALCAFFLRHIFCALELLRNSFIAHKKRRIQPERYVKYGLKWFELEIYRKVIFLLVDKIWDFVI